MLKAALERYTAAAAVSVNKVMSKLSSLELRLTCRTPRFLSFFFFCGGFSLKAVILALVLCVKGTESVCVAGLVVSSEKAHLNPSKLIWASQVGDGA